MSTFVSRRDIGCIAPALDLSALREAVKDGRITHVQDTRGRVEKIFALNKASVSLNTAASSTSVRWPYARVNALGVLADTDETTEVA